MDRGLHGVAGVRGLRQAMRASGAVGRAVLCAGFCVWWSAWPTVGMAGDVVCGVVLPPSPEDPYPPGGDAARCAVSLTGGTGGFIQGPDPVRVVADGDEGSPVDGVTHSFVRGVAEPHLPAPAGGAGDRCQTGLGQQGCCGWRLGKAYLYSLLIPIRTHLCDVLAAEIRSE
jgi:hypothetical protein